jgi:hypothetical protein
MEQALWIFDQQRRACPVLRRNTTAEMTRKHDADWYIRHMDHCRRCRGAGLADQTNGVRHCVAILQRVHKCHLPLAVKLTGDDTDTQTEDEISLPGTHTREMFCVVGI